MFFLFFINTGKFASSPLARRSTQFQLQSKENNWFYFPHEFRVDRSRGASAVRSWKIGASIRHVKPGFVLSPDSSSDLSDVEPKSSMAPTLTFSPHDWGPGVPEIIIYTINPKKDNNKCHSSYLEAHTR